MDQAIIFEAMWRSCSAERLAPYNASAGSQAEVLALYFWNIELAKELLIAFHLFEVALRNEMNIRIKSFYANKNGYASSGNWFEDGRLINQEEMRRVDEAKSKFFKRRGSYPGEGDVIAELSFGFWVALFRGSYEHKSENYKGLWPHLWKPERFFQKCPKIARSREAFSALLEPLRELRNRVAHHEPIYNRPNLLKEYQDIKLLLGWIDPVLPAQLDVICDFEQVYIHGVAGSRWALANPA